MSLGGFDDDEVIAPVLGHADDDEYHLFDKGEVMWFLMLKANMLMIHACSRKWLKMVLTK